MKVRIVCSETGTGEKVVFDTELPELTVTAVIAALNAESAIESIVALNSMDMKTESNDTLGFLFRTNESYFGSVLWAGFAYTMFNDLDKTPKNTARCATRNA